MLRNLLLYQDASHDAPMMSSGGYDLKGALEDLKANWYGASEDGQTAALQAQREPPRVKPEGEREVGTCAINSPLSESLSDSYVDVGLQDEAELLGSNPPAATTEGAQLTASVSSTTGSGSLLATVAGVIAATGKSVAVAAAKSAGLCGDVSSGQKDRGEPPEKGKKEAGEEEEAPLQDEYVKVDSSMHQGHVNVRVIKQGWLKKQVFRVIDGRPNWRRHFVRWKQVRGRLLVVGWVLARVLLTVHHDVRACLPAVITLSDTSY